MGSARPRGAVVVNPARAGMILLDCPARYRWDSKPRASGDDPHVLERVYGGGSVNPARAGMIPTTWTASMRPSRKPRASGDDPG